MAGHRLSLSFLLPGLLLLLLAVIALAAAPVFAARANSLSQEMAASSAGPCAAMAGTDSHSHGNHAGECLVACLSAHAAVLPEAPAQYATRQFPGARAKAGPAQELEGHPFGTDPPPPRTA